MRNIKAQDLQPGMVICSQGQSHHLGIVQSIQNLYRSSDGESSMMEIAVSGSNHAGIFTLHLWSDKNVQVAESKFTYLM
jgi:hypothetical protein